MKSESDVHNAAMLNGRTTCVYLVAASPLYLCSVQSRERPAEQRLPTAKRERAVRIKKRFKKEAPSPEEESEA